MKFIIDPKQYKRNNSVLFILVAFDLIWTAGFLFGIRKNCQEFSFGLLLILCLIGFVIIFTSYILINFNRPQIISLTDEHIVFNSIKPMKSKSILKSNIKSLYIREGDSGGPYFMLAHNKDGKIEEVPIASFIGIEGKIKLLESFSSFLTENNIHHDVNNYLDNK